MLIYELRSMINLILFSSHLKKNHKNLIVKLLSIVCLTELVNDYFQLAFVVSQTVQSSKTHPKIRISL